ncbi:T9SS type A sorting domain-containing protein [bacterium SCSIO 12741]|nr:T9SS type A sorting domain-containing protein [bacterium SCSIO 12741]
MNRFFRLSTLFITVLSAFTVQAQVNDGAIVEQISPDTCASSNNVMVVVENKGSATMTSVSIGWTVNGTSQTRARFSGLNLSTNQKDTVSLGAFSFGGGSTDVVIAWTDSVSGSIDDNRSNDTLKTNVHTPPTATFTALADVCENGGSVTLNQGSGTPAGGTETYFGNGVNGGIFEPSQAQSGVHVISYVYTAPNGCSDTATQNITVDTIPQVSFTGGNPVCENNGIFPLTSGLPMGGNYSGVGVSNNIFDPAVAGPGVHNITYTYTDSKGCADSVSAQQGVDSITIASVTLPVSICLNGDSIILNTGMPAGGTYSGNQVNGNVYLPVGAGFDTVMYTFTNGLGCTDIDTATIRVDVTPKVGFRAIGDVCRNSGLVSLSQGTPTGGVYSGPHVVNGQYDPVNDGVDTLKYVYVDNRGCSDSAYQTIRVDSLPIVRLIPFPSNCENNPAFMLSGGLPFGGTYSGRGVIGNQYHPSQAGSGLDTIKYVFVDGNNCSDSTEQTIMVNPAPTVTITTPAPVCSNEGAVNLSGGMPNGGEYHGMYVNRATGSFDTDAAGAGKHQFGYTFTDVNNCRDSIFDTLEVVAAPVFSLGADTSMCGDAKVTLDPGIANMTYNWSTGETTQTIEVQKSDLFWVELTDNSTAANCSARDTVRVDYDSLCLGLNPITQELAEVVFYPNPNNGSFHMNVSGLAGLDLEVRIFSPNGQEVYNKQWVSIADFHQANVDLQVDPGVYLIQVISGDQAATHRLLVQ